MMKFTLAVIATAILPKDLLMQFGTRVFLLFYGLAEYSENFKFIFDRNTMLYEDIYIYNLII